MEKVSFRLVAALSVHDRLTKKQLNSPMVLCDRDLKTEKKTGGIVVLVEPGKKKAVSERRIIVSDPFYQQEELFADPDADLTKVWLIPGKNVKLPALTGAVSGKAKPGAEVKLRMTGKDTGMKVMALSEKEISLARASKRDPEGEEFLLTDGETECGIVLREFLTDTDGVRNYKISCDGKLPDPKKAKLFALTSAKADEKGMFYLPVRMEGAEGEAVLLVTEEGKTREIPVKLSDGKITETAPEEA